MSGQIERTVGLKWSLSSGQRQCLWGVLAVLCVIRILLMFQIPFTDTTEARYAEIARKMVETNDWVTPQFDYGIPFWGKPPLHMWLSAAGMKVFGVGQFGARIFIFMTGVFIVWILYLWAKAQQGRDYALVGTVLMASSALFYLAFATVMTDLVMLAGTALSMAGFYAAVNRRSNARLWGYLFFVGLAIGMLAKGPVAVVLAGIPIGVWVLLRNRWVDTWQQIPWVTGGLLACCIFVPWYVMAELKTPGFLEYFIVGEHWNRFLVSGWEGDLYGHGHAEPRGMIWGFWFAAMLPWSFFFIVPLVWCKRVFAGIRSEQSGWSLYLLCWALAPMLFFTMATNIIATYVITGVPAVCFLAADLWKYALRVEVDLPRGLVRFFGVSLGVACVLFMTAYGVVALGHGRGMKQTQKYLVERVDALRDSDSGGLYYWDKRYYSAEFYVAGHVRTIEKPDALELLLENQTRDFLVIRKGRSGQIPASVLKHFSSEGIFGKSELYYEHVTDEKEGNYAKAR